MPEVPNAGVNSTGLILGIESSCDETAAAVVRDGRDVLANVVASQVELHATYGGVVPELASREHLRNIVPVVRAALTQAGVALSDLDAIAVTAGPGLAGALLVGIVYAQALAFGLNKPLIAVNHLEGHIHAVLMDAGRTHALRQAYPLLALVVSGGHTHLYLAQESASGAWSYRNVGRTVDDAAGEAFDKVAKLLGLGYPGGPWLDALAPHGDAAAVPFQFHAIKPRSGAVAPSQEAPSSHETPSTQAFDFSFSGIKTAVLRYVQSEGMAAVIETRRQVLLDRPGLRPQEMLSDPQLRPDARTLNLIASFQAAVVGNLMRQTFAAAGHFGVHGLVISGGVAANRELRRRFTAEAARRQLPIGFPAPALATDNAAMIAAAAWPRLLAGEAAPESMAAQPQLRLGG